MVVFQNLNTSNVHTLIIWCQATVSSLEYILNKTINFSAKSPAGYLWLPLLIVACPLEMQSPGRHTSHCAKVTVPVVINGLRGAFLNWPTFLKWWLLIVLLQNRKLTSRKSIKTKEAFPNSFPCHPEGHLSLIAVSMALCLCQELMTGIVGDCLGTVMLQLPPWLYLLSATG